MEVKEQQLPNSLYTTAKNPEVEKGFPPLKQTDQKDQKRSVTQNKVLVALITDPQGMAVPDFAFFCYQKKSRTHLVSYI